MLMPIALIMIYVPLSVAVLGLLVWGLPQLVFRALVPVERLFARLEDRLEAAQAPPEPRLGGPFLPGPHRPPSSA